MFLNNFLSGVGLAFGLLLGGGVTAHAAEGLFPGSTVMAAPQQPAKLPDFELPNLSGGTLKSADMKGKVVIIRFWATW